MPVLVTGATGFLGSRLVHHLLSRDDDTPVVVLGRDAPDVLLDRVRAAVAWLDVNGTLRPGAYDRLRGLSADLAGAGPLPDAAAAAPTAVWHCAAATALYGDPLPVHRVNVLGTRRVLELADRLPAARLAHVSTAYVAGRRTRGVVRETDLCDAAGFHNAYEQSKFTAERMVRHWARARGRTVTVLRPSVLLDDRPAPEGLPPHPFAVLSRTLRATLDERAARTPAAPYARGGTPPGTLRFRLQGAPDGSLNLLQADWAVRAMVRAVTAHREPGALTVHVTHPDNTPVRAIARAMEAVHPGVSLTIVPRIDDPTRLEAHVIREFGPLLGYGGQHRTYERTRLAACVGDLPAPRPVDGPYLERALAVARP
ncbi:SDR family oxidoreductase [Streptomyces sp. NPDC021100]|uniref:SDR family oxidoreductase n=1 Tax=Streptomyces sp. NPDC021100 TaxID=3365114 RepID=UPI003795E4C4